MQSEESLPALARAAFEQRFPFILIVLDPAFNVEWMSDAVGHVLGYDPAALVGTNVLSLVHPDDLEQLVPMAATMVGSATDVLETPSVSGQVELPGRMLHADGRWMPMAVSGRILDTTGRLVLCLRMAVDRHAVDTILECVANNANLAITLDALLGLVRTQFEMDNAWFVQVRPDGIEVHGPEQPDLVGSAGCIVDRLRREGLPRTPFLEEGRWVAPVLSGTGESLLGLLMFDSPTGAEPNAYDQHVLERTSRLASLAISRVESTELLHVAATTDPLTGLLNRRALQSEILRLAVTANALPAVVIYADVDGFKGINDTWGHESGDEMLIALAQRLRGSLRTIDAVARLGGDEFAVVCPGMPPHLIEPAIVRLQDCVAGPVALRGGRRIDLNVSFGGAAAETDHELDDLLARADAAMYLAKRRRKQADLTSQLQHH